MSGFWHEGEETIFEKDREATHSVLSYPREAFLYWLDAWNHCYSNQEGARHQYGLPPWMQFKRPEELSAMGFNVQRDKKGNVFIKSHDA